jgi:hypothetical protein
MVCRVMMIALGALFRRGDFRASAKFAAADSSLAMHLSGLALVAKKSGRIKIANLIKTRALTRTTSKLLFDQKQLTTN